MGSFALSATLFDVPVSADVYKLEIKGEANNIRRFYAENLDKRTKDAFSVRMNAHRSYEFVSEQDTSSSIFTDLVFGEKIKFKIGSISVSYYSEAGDLRIALSGGCAEDSLILPKCPCMVVLGKDTSLKLNTFVMQNAMRIFRNEGTLEAFITCFADCEIVENRGNLASRNLFLLRSNVLNFGTITWCDAYRNVECNIKNFDLEGKKGIVEIGQKTGNTVLLKEMDPKAKIHNFGGKQCVDFDCSFVPSEDISKYPEYQKKIKHREPNFYPMKINRRSTVVAIADFWHEGAKKSIEISSSDAFLTDPKRLFVGQTLASAELAECPEGFKKHILITSGWGVSVWTPKTASDGVFSKCFISVDDDPRMYFIGDNPDDHEKK